MDKDTCSVLYVDFKGNSNPTAASLLAQVEKLQTENEIVRMRLQQLRGNPAADLIAMLVAMREVPK